MATANHMHRHHGGEMHHTWDALSWPVALTSPLVWPTWPWAADLWAHAPTPTALYMVVSAVFMLFQMSDKLGLLRRFVKPNRMEEPPEKPEPERREPRTR